MIKIQADYTRKLINENGDLEVTFTIKDYASKKRFDELNKDIYQLEITKPRSKRSLNQNRLFWKMVGLISSKLNQDEMEIYILLLEDTNAKYEYIMGIEAIEDELKRTFRAVKVVRPEYHNGKKFIIYKVFYGSSKFDTKEMTMLIDKTMTWCHELDIPIEDEY